MRERTHRLLGSADPGRRRPRGSRGRQLLSELVQCASVAGREQDLQSRSRRKPQSICQQKVRPQRPELWIVSARPGGCVDHERKLAPRPRSIGLARVPACVSRCQSRSDLPTRPVIRAADERRFPPHARVRRVLDRQSPTRAPFDVGDPRKRRTWRPGRDLSTPGPEQHRFSARSSLRLPRRRPLAGHAVHGERGDGDHE